VTAETDGNRSDLERLAALGSTGGPAVEEALRILARLRSTPDEHRAVAHLLESDARARLPEALTVALAAALLDRGDHRSAARILSRAESSPALMMRAEAAARAGDPATALALVERVLARDIDWPGARERHARWVEKLGLEPKASRAEAWETVVAAAPDAPFELLREVGRGGAGVVYEARDLVLGRPVALKIYHHPERDRAQLLHETRVAASLGGPGVVRVFDVDLERGWLAMEWSPLGSLGARFRCGDLCGLVPLEGWAVPLAQTLARVHAAGWVHHDLKPANVLLRAPRSPLITDFGTARRVGEPSPPGSTGYVSPERLARRPSNARDDVYGFGRILEEALAALSDPKEGGWRALAAACTGPDARRPKDGAELLARAAGVGNGSPL
jgi:eukaryotic-like serine/threonine-protein kinase